MPKGPAVFQEFKGIRNDVAPEHMGAGDLVEAVNVDIDNAGRLARRDGFGQLVVGTDLHSLFSGSQVAVVVEGTTLCRVQNNALTTLGTGLTAGLAMAYCEVDGRIYHANGVQRGVIEGGIARSWGLRVPPAPVAAAIAGDMPAGTYAVAITAVASDGTESGAGTGTEITLAAAGGIAVTVPAATTSRVTAHRVWCTAPDGAQLYLAGAIASGTFSITQAVPLTSPITTQFYGPPPSGHLIAYYRGRLYVAADNALYPSAAFAYELFRQTDAMPFANRIDMVAPTLDGIYVSDGACVRFLSGADPGSFAPREVGPRALPRSLAFAQAHKVGHQGAFQIPVWMSANGPVVGGPGGAITQFSKEYTTTLDEGTAALVREVAGTYQYLMCGG